MRRNVPNLRILQKSQAALRWQTAWRCAAIPTPNGCPLPIRAHIQKQPAPRKPRCRLLFRLIYSASENAAPMSNARPAKNACALMRLLPAGCNSVIQSAFSPHATTMPSASAAKMHPASPCRSTGCACQILSGCPCRKVQAAGTGLNAQIFRATVLAGSVQRILASSLLNFWA